MPDREGKTLDMSPAALLGCAEVEVFTRRFGEMSGTLARAHFQRLCTLGVIVMVCIGMR